MAKTMNTSEMTDGQIERVLDQLRSAMQKHRSEIASDTAQQVLGIDNLGMRMFSVFRELAEEMGDLIVRQVKVNRSRTLKEVLDATGRKQYVNDQVVATMPKGEREEAIVCFFKLGRFVSDDELEKEYERRGFEPSDPFSLAAFNEADPAFADDHPNCTHWKDEQGKWCFAAFERWGGERDLTVERSAREWRAVWWFAGVRK